jgi:hypothetical protein
LWEVGSFSSKDDLIDCRTLSASAMVMNDKVVLKQDEDEYRPQYFTPAMQGA